MSSCLICHQNLIPVLNLGQQPSANNLLQKSQLSGPEYQFNLSLGFCDHCKNVQTMERPKKDLMFKDEYAYFTSANAPMVAHFKKLADEIKKNHLLGTNDLVVEIGSNDGVFLLNLKDHQHLGIEPSLNVAEVARKKGIDCWNNFFDESSAQKILSKKGEAKVIFAANVFGHVEDIQSVVKGIKKLLAPDGVFIFEIYYLPSIVEKSLYDLIYDEHIFYYTATSLEFLFESFGLQIYDIEKIEVHGGSIRGYVSHKDYRAQTERLKAVFKDEENRGYKTPAPLIQFAKKVETLRVEFQALLKKLKSDGKKIAGYGATAKSTTILNYCGIDSSYIDFIADSTPFKQNKYTPGTHIPIQSEEYFVKNHPDFTILFAWNYAKEIRQKQSEYEQNGGKWISIHPKVEII